MIENVRVGRSVGIEIVSGLLKPPKVLARVRAQNCLIRRDLRLQPLQMQVLLLLEPFYGPADSLWPLRVTCANVIGAAAVRNDSHGLNLTQPMGITQASLSL